LSLLLLNAHTNKLQHDACFSRELITLNMFPNKSHEYKDYTHKDLFLSFIFQGWVLQQPRLKRRTKELVALFAGVLITRQALVQTANLSKRKN
jgi:hypothetical protein